MPLAQSGSEASHYGDEAIALLEQTVLAGWNDPPLTARGTHLANLHQRDGFRRLVASLFDRVFPSDPFAR